MRGKLRSLNPYIVTLLLTGFICVFLCDVLCDLGMISWGNYSAIVEKVDHHTIKKHSHDASEHGHDEDDEDVCCDEVVNNLYRSLIKYEIKQVSIEIPVIHLQYNVYSIAFQAKIFNQKILSFLYTNLPPPIRGYHIRIYIQSFLN